MASATFTENRSVAASPVMSAGPLFVVGMWRSGTSLLYALLNQHPQIALMYEAELPLLQPLFWIPGGKSDWAERWNFWNSALDRHQIAASDLRSSPLSLADAMRAVYTEYARRKGATIWGGKSPNYYDSLVQLSRTFPKAQFIVIWRDPSDICRSVVRAAEKDDWFSKRGILNRSLFGLHQMKRQCDFLINRGVPLHQIEYEDLIHRPADVMEETCRFLGISFDRRMTSLQGADRSAVYEGEHHAGVRSEQIVPNKPRPEVLPLPLQKKIQRYLFFWRKKYGNAWLPLSRTQLNEEPKPGLMERVADALLFRLLRTLDQVVALIYCFAPLSLLKRYRAIKSHSREAVAKDCVG